MGSHQRKEGLWLTLLFRKSPSMSVKWISQFCESWFSLMMFGLDWLREGMDKGAGRDREMGLHWEGRRRMRKAKEMMATLFCHPQWRGRRPESDLQGDIPDPYLSDALLVLDSIPYSYLYFRSNSSSRFQRFDISDPHMWDALLNLDCRF